jgi:hypothetical protein
VWGLGAFRQHQVKFVTNNHSVWQPCLPSSVGFARFQR